MPRQSRKKTETKVYHIIIRGINKQDIFLDKQDYLKYIKEIKRTKEKYNYEIYAYALMNDHIHMIIFDKNNNISTAIQSLNISYSSYFNKKYERTGHLFENRFKSKVVEDRIYLKRLIRYIHKNPENAGMIPYQWTSYNEFIFTNKIIRKNTILDLFGNNYKDSIKAFIQFHNNYNKYDDYNKEYELVRSIKDEDAICMIKNIIKEENLIKIQQYEKNKRDMTILKILKIEGISKQQISRITGLNRKTIAKIESKNNQ